QWSRAMSRLRFSIASLLGLVLFLAVGLAALREATDLWDSAVFTTTVALLLVSVLLAVHRIGRGRAFWLGFAVFGWLYVGLSLVPQIEPRPLTTKGLAWLDSKVESRTLTLAIDDSRSMLPGAGSVAFSPDGRILAATQRGVVWLLDSATGKLLSRGSSQSFIR